MSKDEFETLGRPQQQKRALADDRQQQKALLQEQHQQQRSTSLPDLEIEPRAESFDTVPTETLNWWLPALLGGGVGILAMLAVGARVFSPEKQVVSTSPDVPAPTAAVPEGELLLEQANLLAVTGDLTGAVEIASSIPTGSETYAEAQQQVTVWEGAIANARAAELASAQAQAAEVRQQQEVAQAQAQAAEARRQQEAAQAQAQAAEARRQQEVAQAQAQIAAARQQQGSASTQAQAAAARQQQEAAQARIQAAEAQAAEARRQQEAAQAQAAEARRQQEAAQAQAQAAEARQQQLARAQTRQQPTGNPNNPPAPTQAQQPATPSPTPDPFLSNSVATKLAPATTAAPVQVAAAPTVPAIPENSYGFRNVTVAAPTVAISLRDNVDEDGDFVTLRVNGKEYATNTRIWNSGKVVFVPLNPGQNLVEIVAVKDGQGGITLEADVAGVGNINNRPIPEGRTASFIINRED